MSRKNRNNKKGEEKLRPRGESNRRKTSLEKPLRTQNTTVLLLPPDARLRFVLKNPRMLDKQIWGLQEAMMGTTLVFTAWDGSVKGKAEANGNSISVSLPFCSNGVSRQNRSVYCCMIYQIVNVYIN